MCVYVWWRNIPVPSGRVVQRRNDWKMKKKGEEGYNVKSENNKGQL